MDGRSTPCGDPPSSSRRSLRPADDRGRSLGGTLGLGVTADQAAVPELDFLLHRIEQTAQDLISAAG